MRKSRRWWKALDIINAVGHDGHEGEGLAGLKAIPQCLGAKAALIGLANAQPRQESNWQVAARQASEEFWRQVGKIDLST